MARISYRGITKSYGVMEVIHGVDIEVEDGEFVVFVGPSGCGKSTLLRMLAGLESVTSGEIRIGGTEVTGLPPKDRDVAMVFQNYALYPHMSVAENIGFPLRIQGMPSAERAGRVRETAGLLGLTGLLDRYPRELSGGQRQRVAMGRAIVRHPQVFLFDEPLSNLDAALRVQMRKEIRQMHDRLGATMIYVTHDQVEAMTMADRIVVLRDGRVEQCAPPLDIYRRPANVFVARFIGSPPINLIPCLAGVKVASPEGSSLRLPLPPGIEPGRQVSLGIRPEDLRLAAPQDGQATGRVSYVEVTGQDSAISLDLGWAGLTATLRGTAEFREGDEVGVSFPEAALHVFDEEGRRIGP